MLSSRYGIHAEAAPPGNPARAQATGSGGGHFICIGAVTENKRQLLITEALRAIIADERGRDDRGRLTSWHCTFAGPIVEADYAHRLRTACADLPEGRAEVVGELAEDELDALYGSADLLLLPSRSEAYGMVVAEAAAAGIPSFVTSGTGAEEPLRSGLSLPADRESWARALRRWMDDEHFRVQLRAEAQQRREEAVRGWDQTAADVFGALAGHRR
nr:glycosyltransferase [Brevibacterium renqingii]